VNKETIGVAFAAVDPGHNEHTSGAGRSRARESDCVNLNDETVMDREPPGLEDVS